MGLRAMKLLYKTIITLLMLIVSTTISAGSVWDGSVSTARYGYLPQTGMYAASNAFPQNTRVTVTNPDTGKSVDVIVLERLENNNLFLVLSSEAAESVGLGYGEIFHGSVSEQLATGPGTEEDFSYNPDPDVNPSALSNRDSELALIQEYIDSELGGVDESLIIPDTEVEPELPVITPVTEDISVNEVEHEIPFVENMPDEDVYSAEPDKLLPIPDPVKVTSDPEFVEGVEDEIPLVTGMSTSVPLAVVELADISGSIPELPVPEEDTPVVTSMSAEILEETENGIAVSELPELPVVEIEEVLSDEEPVAVTMTADVVEIEETELSLILPSVVSIDEKSELPEEDELVMDVEVVLEPSDLRPPVAGDEAVVEAVKDIEEIGAAEVAEDEIPAAATYNMTRALAQDSYYLQLGAYREQYAALDLAGRIGGIYPVTVYISDSDDLLNYKVMVGPLGSDESGAVLYSFRSSGYPDAFLRKGL